MSPPSILLSNGKVRCVDTGGPGPAVLLTHGIGESLEFWHPLEQPAVFNDKLSALVLRTET